MGMFDNIRWEGSLPDGWQDDGDMQTKSFDCGLGVYKVDGQGRLLFLKGSEWFDDLTDEWVETGYTGDVHFWGGEPGSDTDWHEYHALFVSGRLASIEARDLTTYG